MGNFDHLAKKILAKNKTTNKSFQFSSLREETGNFQPKIANLQGNILNKTPPENLYASDIKVETHEVTSWKLLSKNDETLPLKSIAYGFLNENNYHNMLKCFFENAKEIGIELLHDDKRWLQLICQGLPLKQLKELLTEYIKHWCHMHNAEQVSQKKQNAGRYAANTWIRETLSN